MTAPLGAGTVRRVQKEDGRRTRFAHRRGELVRAAAEYVFEHGLADLSLRPLAEALGISHKSLLRHFGSKEQLLVEILEEARTRERMLLAQYGAPDEDPPSTRALAAAAWERWTMPAHLPFLRLYFEVQALALQHPDRFGDYLQSTTRDWKQLAQAVLERDGVPPERAVALAGFAFATVRGLQLELLHAPDRAPVDAAFEQFVIALGEVVKAEARA